MIHVILDTNIYRAKPCLDSQDFKALTYLATEENICIHIPYIIEHEFLSYTQKEREQKASEAIEDFSAITNNKELNGIFPDLHQYLEKFKEEDIKDKIESKNKKKKIFLEWAENTKAMRYDSPQDETENVLKAYFYGGEPFKDSSKKSKRKNDIPDAFIYESVKIIYAEHKTSLHFISGDDNLCKACRSYGILVHEDLQKFIETEMIQKILTPRIIEKNKDAIYNIFCRHKKSQEYKILEKIKKSLSEDEFGMIFEYIEKNTAEYISSDRNVEFMNKPLSPKTTPDVKYYPNGVFILHFTSQIHIKCDVLEGRIYYDGYGEVTGHDDEPSEVTKEYEVIFQGNMELKYTDLWGAIKTSKELFEILENNPTITISNLRNFKMKDISVDEFYDRYPDYEDDDLD